MPGACRRTPTPTTARSSTRSDVPGYPVSYRCHSSTRPLHHRIKVSIEHGHANHLSDDWAATAYWYQTLPCPGRKSFRLVNASPLGQQRSPPKTQDQHRRHRRRGRPICGSATPADTTSTGPASASEPPTARPGHEPSPKPTQSRPATFGGGTSDRHHRLDCTRRRAAPSPDSLHRRRRLDQRPLRDHLGEGPLPPVLPSRTRPGRLGPALPLGSRRIDSTSSTGRSSRSRWYRGPSRSDAGQAA